MQIKIIIGTIAFMLTMILMGFYALLEPSRLANFADARLGRQVEAGAQLYYANCSTCHGVNGLGSSGGECYDSATGEPIACQGRPLNWRGLQCEDGGKTQRMIERGWAGTNFGFIHATIASGRQGGVMPAWSQQYGGPLQENEVENVTLFVLNWHSEELCAFTPVVFPWPWPDEAPNAAFEAASELDEDAVREANPDLTPEEELPFELPMYPGDAERGADLYANQYACTACHGNPEGDPASANVGPWHGNLGNLAATRIEGVSAEAYIYQSILIPEAYIVDGYANAMQSYADAMGASPQDMMDIITYMMERQAGE